MKQVQKGSKNKPSSLFSITKQAHMLRYTNLSSPRYTNLKTEKNPNPPTQEGTSDSEYLLNYVRWKTSSSSHKLHSPSKNILR